MHFTREGYHGPGFHWGTLQYGFSRGTKTRVLVSLWLFYTFYDWKNGLPKINYFYYQLPF